MAVVVNYYESCNLCPRRCSVNRYTERGYCGEGAELRIACASIHRGEEPPITGAGGSGTVFISGCNLGCVFCQNHQISQPAVSPNDIQVGDTADAPVRKTAPMGRVVSTAEFAQICLALQNEGAENINIVTGSHVIPAIAAGLDAARVSGLRIPALWNTSSYETADALELLRGRIHTFLPDLKTLDTAIASRFFNAPDYPKAAQQAILKMIELAGDAAEQNASAGQSDKAERVIIRHLILPDYLESTRQVLRWFADNARGRALLSLMTQYTPPAVNSEAVISGRAASAGIPSRYVNEAEYDTVIGWLEEFGIDDGFCQELVTGSDWLPDFTRYNPFSSDLSKPVWHWSQSYMANDPNSMIKIEN